MACGAPSAEIHAVSAKVGAAARPSQRAASQARGPRVMWSPAIMGVVILAPPFEIGRSAAAELTRDLWAEEHWV